MKALKIVGIVFGILLLLTGGGLAVGSALANKGQTAFAEEVTKSGYAGPVDGTVRSLNQGEPVVVTVSYTDEQGKNQVGQGTFAGGRPPQVGDIVSTYYNTSDPSRVVVISLPGPGDLSALADILGTAAIICLIVGSVLLLAGILGLALGKRKPAAVAPGPMYPSGPPQPSSAGYPTQPQPPGQPYPPQPSGQGYSAQQPPGQPYPPQPSGQGYSAQQPPGQPYPPQQQPGQPYPLQQDPPER